MADRGEAAATTWTGTVEDCQEELKSIQVSRSLLSDLDQDVHVFDDAIALWSSRLIASSAAGRRRAVAVAPQPAVAAAVPGLQLPPLPLTGPLWTGRRLGQDAELLPQRLFRTPGTGAGRTGLAGAHDDAAMATPVAGVYKDGRSFTDYVEHLNAQILPVLNSLAAALNVGHWRDLSEDAFLHQVTLILRARGETDVERLASALYAISTAAAKKVRSHWHGR